MRITMLTCALVLSCLGRADAGDSVVPFTGIRGGRGVAVARDGVIYAGGFTERSTLSELRPEVTALTADHRVLWTKRWNDRAIVTAVVTDERGPIVALLRRGPRFDPECPGVDPSEATAVVLALDADGSCRWARTFAGSSIAISTAPDGSLAVAPLPDWGRATITYLDGRGRVVRDTRLPAGIAPQRMTSNGRQLFIAGSGGRGWLGALDADGTLQWTTVIDVTQGVVIPFEIAADRDHVVIGGLFRGAAHFAGRVRRSFDDDDDGFVARYDLRGKLEWVYTYGTASSDQVRGVALVGADTYAIANRTEGAQPGGDAVLTGDTQVFLIRLDASGVPREARPVVDQQLGAYSHIYIDTMIRTDAHLLVIGEVSGPARAFGEELPHDTALLFDLAL